MSPYPATTLEHRHGPHEDRRLDDPVRVLIIDDHPAICAGLEGVLALEPDLVAVGSAANAREGLAQAQLLSPQAAIVDYHLPGRDGLSLTLQLKRLDQPPAVVIYSAFADARLAIGALVAGADGVVEKSSRPDELCAALRTVTGGRLMIPSVPSEMTTIAAGVDPDDLPILGMLMNGVAPGEVAEVLGITEEWLDMRRWAILQRITASAR